MALAVQRLPETIRQTSLPGMIAVYWHLLSLDAPSVAALWSWSFARVAHVALPPFAPLLLAVGTWLVYVADRLLDGMSRHHQLRERHYFYVRHRRLFLLAGTFVCPVFTWIVFTRMAPDVRREDSAIFALAMLYFLLVHMRGRQVETWLPKELAVGALFAAATAVPAWARITGYNFLLASSVILFAILCWLNCVAIENWERRDSDAVEVPHRTTLWAGRHLQLLAMATALIAATLAFAVPVSRALFALYLASASSALLFFWLARSERRLTTTQLRIAADAALLTPLFFLAWMR